VIKLVYVAGPFSAPDRAGVEKNIEAAASLGLLVAELGACPWIPHANTALPEFEHVQSYQFWIDATKLQLLKCDAIVMRKGWESSSGSRGEHALAQTAGIPIFYEIEELLGRGLGELRSWIEASK
jgi:hypothetical protein